MELILWRWSTATQVLSCLLIGAFFVAFERTTRRPELRWWMWAWVANLVALAVTVLFWYHVPPFDEIHGLTRGAYAGAKSAFALLLLQGAWALRRPSGRLASPRLMMAALGGFVFLAVFVADSLESLGLQQHILLSILFSIVGVGLLRGEDAAVKWLAGGCLARAVLEVPEAAAWGLMVLGPDAMGTAWIERAGLFLSVSSGLDVAVEWLLALSCVLSLTTRREQELRAVNASLEAVQAELRGLVDRDALTGLPNRGALPDIFRRVYDQGAMLLFLDLDEFKRINDRMGHAMGDAALKRVADELRATFRPDDDIVRYGGDEFVVMATGLSPADADRRVADLRARLRSRPDGMPAVSFSVGTREVRPGESAEEALRAADAAMYREKGAR